MNVMMKTVARTYEPQQKRSRETMERALETGLGILIDEGWDALTVAKVCERANMSAGTFYRRFKSREELVSILQERWIADAFAVLDEITRRDVNWKSLKAPAAFEKVMRFISEGFERNEVQTRLFGLYGTFDQNGLKQLLSISQGYGALFRAALKDHAQAIKHAEPDKAVDFAFRIIIDALIRHITHSKEYDLGGAMSGWHEFVDELIAMCSGYLFHAFGRADER